MNQPLLTFFIFLSGFIFSQQKQHEKKTFAIVIHGGAGTILKEKMSEEMEKAYKEKLEEALKAGYDTLSKGGAGIDAVVAAIKVMEDSPLFNAGKGSVFTAEGKKMDASIMDGKTLNAGAVAGISNLKNPITAALCVMRKSPHVMMAGAGAEKFAATCNCETADSSYFFEPGRWKSLQKIKEKEKMEMDHGSINSHDPVYNDYKFGTVGVVALDQFGNLASGTSTGGMTNKKHGRIGDSPIIGAGTYANNKTCGVSCTGHGEFFIRAVVAHEVSALMEHKGLSVSQAATEVVMKKLKEMGGEGGLIAMDKNGNIAMPFNTSGMYRGFMKSNGEKQIFIFK